VDKGDGGHGHRVGHLGGHVVQVVALSAGGRHDGGVGDGGAVVAHDRAAQGGADAHHQDGHFVQSLSGQVVEAAGGEDLQHDGQQDAEGAPGGAGGEAQAAGDQEHHGGKEVVQ